MYNNNSFTNFPNYYPTSPTAPTTTLPYSNQNLIRQEIVRVNGRNGAEAYQLAPNSSILLLDESAPIVWVKMTDGAGYPTLTPYDISPHQSTEQLNFSSLEERISKLEEFMNDQSNFRTSQPKQQKVVTTNTTANTARKNQ